MNIPMLKTKGPEKQQAGDGATAADLLDLAIGGIYDTEGTTEQLVFRTTAELKLELSDVADFSLTAIAGWLRKRKCATRVVDGTLCWVLYDRRDPSRL